MTLSQELREGAEQLRSVPGGLGFQIDLMETVALRIEQVYELRERLANMPQGDGWPPDGSVWLLDQILAVFEAKEAEV